MEIPKGLQALNDLRYYCSLSQDLGISYIEMNELCDIIEKELRAKWKEDTTRKGKEIQK